MIGPRILLPAHPLQSRRRRQARLTARRHVPLTDGTCDGPLER
jgi:hypothetical protein